MTEQQCGDRLPGLVPGMTLECELPTDHHGRHQDSQLGPIIEWTPNALRMLRGAAA